MRAIILSGSLFLLNVAFNISLAKGWADSIPNWVVILLWTTPLIPLIWWVLTHKKLAHHRTWLRERFRANPYSSTIVATVVVLVILISLAGAGYRAYASFANNHSAPVAKTSPPVLPQPDARKDETPNRSEPKVTPIPGTKPIKTGPSLIQNAGTPQTTTQFCEGGNCAQSSGQTGGITAGQINIGSIDRALDINEQQELAGVMTQFADKQVHIFSVNDNGESGRFAASLKAAFDAAGFKNVSITNLGRYEDTPQRPVIIYSPPRRAPVRCTNLNVSSRLMFSGDEVRSRGRRLSPLLWQPCTSFPHARISVAVLANSAGGK